MSDLLIDRPAGRLCDAAGRHFDPRTRTWHPAVQPAPPPAEAVSAEVGLRWLQRESGTPVREPVAVIGGREAGPAELADAEAVGALVADLGLPLLCGGREGVMEAACRGVAARGGISIGLLPDQTAAPANPHVTYVLASGIGIARNAVIARAAAALVAVGGGTGTLTEIGFGLQFGKAVFRLRGAPAVDGMHHVPDPAALAAPLTRAVLGLPPG